MTDVLVSISFVIVITSGLVVIYGWLESINIAHGDLMMVGAYVAASLVSMRVPFAAAVFLSAASTGAYFLVFDRFFLRGSAPSLQSLLTTWAFGTLTSESVRIVTGSSGRYLDAPIHGFVAVGTWTLPRYHLVVLLFGAMLVSVHLIVQRSRVGLRIHAVLVSKKAAEHLGLNPHKVTTYLVFAGGALAGAGGALLAPLFPVTPLLGASYTATAFAVVVLGGQGLTWGPVLAAAFLGGTRSLLQMFVSPSQAYASSLAATVALVFLMPLLRKRR